MVASDLQVLTDIRVALLRYWNNEKDKALKDELSANLNAIDEIINGQRKSIEQRQRILGER